MIAEEHIEERLTEEEEEEGKSLLEQLKKWSIQPGGAINDEDDDDDEKDIQLFIKTKQQMNVFMKVQLETTELVMNNYKRNQCRSSLQMLRMMCRKIHI